MTGLHAYLSQHVEVLSSSDGASAKEDWRPIDGFAGYEVSSAGRIRNWRGRGGLRGRLQTTSRVIRTPLDKDGYQRVVLRTPGGSRRCTKSVHRLVLEAFVGPCPDGMQCRHLNGRRDDNRWPENICWGTPIENMADRDKHGNTVRGDKHYARSRPWLLNRERRDPQKQARGERHGMAKLSRDGALCAIEMLEDGARPIDVARKLGVSDCCVADIKARRTWRHLPRSGGAK